MERKPTYEELEQRVKELEKESLKHRKAKDALRESEEKFRTIFRAERDAIMVFDAEMLRFVEANDATLDLYGYTQEELTARRTSPTCTNHFQQPVGWLMMPCAA